MTPALLLPAGGSRTAIQVPVLVPLDNFLHSVSLPSWVRSSRRGDNSIQCCFDVRPLGFRGVLKKARRNQRGLQFDLPLAALLIMRQEFGFEVDRGRPWFASIREYLQSPEIDLDTFGDEGNEVLHVVA